MPNRKKILVTGADGQLGKSLQKIADRNKHAFFFLNRKMLDITDYSSLKKLLKKEKFDYCINFAAYTNVEKAEEEKERAFKINSEAVGNLAGLSKDFDMILFHISTDYVFDGTKTIPYTEDDAPHPINTYGESKLFGENEIFQRTDKFFIFRTSWLYSDFGHNFYKTIIRLAEDKKNLKIVDDQIGTPTLTYDLSDFIMYLINREFNSYGLYHFSNKGEASWFDFAQAIVHSNQLDNKVVPIKTKDLLMKAKRPHYSVLDKNKIKTFFDFSPAEWDKRFYEWIKNK
jgi:dTDP-4-dehydrorhamnose reductase